MGPGAKAGSQSTDQKLQELERLIEDLRRELKGIGSGLKKVGPPSK
jgi:hypothetical protein